MKSNKSDYKIELTAEAYNDLLHIQNYSFSESGENQWQEYSSLFNKAFLLIQQFPQSGQARPDISGIYLTMKVGQHLIIYRIQETTIYILRVLHQRMDFRYRF